MSKTRLRKRHRPVFHRRTPPGAPPGVVAVDPAAHRSVVQLMAYGPEGFHEQVVTELDTLVEWLQRSQVAWVNVEGLGDAATIKKLGQVFHLHPLALEDVVNVHQRAKVEQYGDHLFIVARMVEFNERLDTEQLSLFLGRNFVLTFVEDPGDSFDPVRQRLRGDVSRLRSSGAGYLAYSLLDAVVDAYFPVIEAYGEKLEDLEDSLIASADRRAISDVYNAKRDLRTLRRAIWPLREAISSLSRESSVVIDDETRFHFRDCYDHTVQIIDLVETYREIGSDLTDLYLSSLSNRMNEIMKVLTIIATIFIPLGFIAGVYGMNFNTDISPWNMPELKWRWGYPFALALMAAVAGAMLVFFQRQGWLSAMLPAERSGASHPPQDEGEAD